MHNTSDLYTANNLARYYCPFVCLGENVSIVAERGKEGGAIQCLIFH